MYVLLCLRDARYFIAFARVVRVTVRREHDAQRNAPVPLSLSLIERSVDGVLDQRQKIALESKQNRLRLRIPQAAVELQRFDGAIRLNHEARVEKPGIRFPRR